MMLKPIFIIALIVPMRLKNWKKPKIKDNKLTKWNWAVRHPAGLVMGKRIDIGAFCYLNAKYGIIIEDDVQIGGGCFLYTENTIDNKKGKIILRKNCKIGANSVIMPGVEIGKNSIVGAMSFINKNVPPNKTTMGIPIK